MNRVPDPSSPHGRTAQPAIVTRLRDILDSAPDTGGLWSADEAAACLGMKRREMGAALRHAGTSFREIRAEVLAERARVLLAEGLPVGEVSERLGYADSRAFHRSYKRWFGTTPGRDR